MTRGPGLLRKTEPGPPPFWRSAPELHTRSVIIDTLSRGMSRLPLSCHGATMTIHQSVLELIGNTPMVRTQHLDTGVCELFLKLENANPGGSVKDRIGLSMIEGAERAGRI